MTALGSLAAEASTCTRCHLAVTPTPVVSGGGAATMAAMRTGLALARCVLEEAA